MKRLWGESLRGVPQGPTHQSVSLSIYLSAQLNQYTFDQSCSFDLNFHFPFSDCNHSSHSCRFVMFCRKEGAAAVKHTETKVLESPTDGSWGTKKQTRQISVWDSAASFSLEPYIILFVLMGCAVIWVVIQLLCVTLQSKVRPSLLFWYSFRFDFFKKFSLKILCRISNNTSN